MNNDSLLHFALSRIMSKIKFMLGWGMLQVPLTSKKNSRAQVVLFCLTLPLKREPKFFFEDKALATSSLLPKRNHLKPFTFTSAIQPRKDLNQLAHSVRV